MVQYCRMVVGGLPRASYFLPSAAAVQNLFFFSVGNSRKLYHLLSLNLNLCWNFLFDSAWAGGSSKAECVACHGIRKWEGLCLQNSCHVLPDGAHEHKVTFLVIGVICRVLEGPDIPQSRLSMVQNERRMAGFNFWQNSKTTPLPTSQFGIALSPVQPWCMVASAKLFQG